MHLLACATFVPVLGFSGLLDKLKAGAVDVVGWSAGVNIGLDLAMRHPARIGKPFAFGANTGISGMSGDPDKQPIFPQVMARMASDYARLSPRQRASMPAPDG